MVAEILQYAGFQRKIMHPYMDSQANIKSIISRCAKSAEVALYEKALYHITKEEFSFSRCAVKRPWNAMR